MDTWYWPIPSAASPHLGPSTTRRFILRFNNLYFNFQNWLFTARMRKQCENNPKNVENEIIAYFWGHNYFRDVGHRHFSFEKIGWVLLKFKTNLLEFLPFRRKLLAVGSLFVLIKQREEKAGKNWLKWKKARVTLMKFWDSTWEYPQQGTIKENRKSKANFGRYFLYICISI